MKTSKSSVKLEVGSCSIHYRPSRSHARGTYFPKAKGSSASKLRSCRITSRCSGDRWAISLSPWVYLPTWCKTHISKCGEGSGFDSWGWRLNTHIRRGLAATAKYSKAKRVIVQGQSLSPATRERLLVRGRTPTRKTRCYLREDNRQVPSPTSLSPARKSPLNLKLSEAANLKPSSGGCVETRTFAGPCVVQTSLEYIPETRSAGGQ